MPIKINGATSGSVTITAPDTGSDQTVELVGALAAKANYPSGGTDGQVLVKSGTTTAWANSGLTLITTATMSAASTLTINDCFSSAYSMYVVQYKFASSSGTSTAVYLRLRVGGVDSTTTYLTQNLSNTSNTLLGAQNPIGGSQNTAWYVGEVSNLYANLCGGVIDIIEPFETAPTTAISRFHVVGNGGTSFANHGTHHHQAVTSYTGLTITMTGTNTATFRVYGLKG